MYKLVVDNQNRFALQSPLVEGFKALMGEMDFRVYFEISSLQGTTAAFIRDTLHKYKYQLGISITPYLHYVLEFFESREYTGTLDEYLLLLELYTNVDLYDDGDLNKHIHDLCGRIYLRLMLEHSPYIHDFRYKFRDSKRFDLLEQKAIQAANDLATQLNR